MSIVSGTEVGELNPEVSEVASSQKSGPKAQSEGKKVRKTRFGALSRRSVDADKTSTTLTKQ